MARGLWRSRVSPLRRRWRAAALDDIAIIVGLTIIGASFTGAALDLWSTVHTRQVLQQAGQIVDRSLVTSGCFTTGAQDQLDSFVQDNGLNPADLVVQAPTSVTPYNGQLPATVLGYDFQIPVPFGSGTLFKTYTQVTVPADQSLAVPGDGANQSGCATDLSATFPGQTNYPGSGSTSNGNGGSSTAVTAITFAASPNPVEAGAAVTLSGVADVGGNPAPSGTTVSLQLPNATLSASVGANGDYSTTWTAAQPGTYTLTATSGLASATASLEVTAASAQTITWQVPGSVTVGQSFTLSATVTDTSGYPVTNGTAVQISSTDPTDIPTTTLTTTNGVVSETIPGGITQNVSSVTVTATAGSASQSATMTVDPGAPQSITLAVGPTTLMAGQSVTLSGQVSGPDGTAPAGGTAVSFASETDTQDSFPGTTTAASGDFSQSTPLTLAGTQQITAQVVSGGKTLTSNVVSVTVAPGPAADLVNGSAAPNPVEQGAVVMFSGTVTDPYGNPVGPGVPVTVTGSGLSQTASTMTGSNGTFSVTDTFDTAGTQDVTVAANGTALTNGTLSVDVLAAAADTLTPSASTTSLTAGSSTTITWTLADSQGNPVTNQPIAFALSPGASGAVTPTSATTNSSGQVTVTVGPLTAAQQYTLTAQASQLSNVTGTAAVSVTPDTADLQVLDPTITPTAVQSSADGGTQTPVITGTITDEYGNLVSGVAVSVTGGWDVSQTATATTDSQGRFSASLDPVTVGGPYYPTIALNGGSGTTYKSTSLDVVDNLYGITLTPTSGSTTTAAGTDYGVLATLVKYGGASAIPVANASVTFTVTSGDLPSNWGTPSSEPTPSSPTSLTLTTDSNGQATAEVAFMPSTGTSTVTASWPTDGTTTALNVTVTANTPSTVYWDNPPSPNPQTAGQAFSYGAQLVDADGFGLSSGQSVQLGVAGAPMVTTTTGYGNGLYGWISDSQTSTQAGTWDVVIQNVNGTGYNGSGQPTLPAAAEKIDPAAMEYFYPALSNNDGSSWLSGYSWTNSSSPSQGPINNFGWRSPLAYQGTRTYWVAGFGVDQYGNQIAGANLATVSCSASNGGGCGSIPADAGGAWQSLGPWNAGDYTLTFTPASSPYPAGIASNAEQTHVTLNLAGITSITDGGTPNYGQHPTITMTGNGFSGAAYNGDSSYFQFNDNTRSWQGGYGTNGVTVDITSWSTTQVVLSGFGGAYGGSYVFDPGDTFTIGILDPVGAWLSGSDQCPPTLITSVSASGSGETTEYIINGQQFGSWGGGATSDYNSPWTWFYDNSKGWVGWHSSTAIYYGTITEWTPTQVIVNPGFGGSYGRSGTNWYVSAGDGVNITIANPQTGTSSGYNFTQP